MAIGDPIGGAIDIYGSNKASNIERRAVRKAGGLIDKGYGESMDLAKPMQQQSQGDYMNLSNKYREGGFQSPDQEVYQGGSYNYDPNQVFNDPEYKANLQAGTQAIDSSAAGKGMLFSGNTGRALQKYGQDLFANRSDELYGRGRQAFESDRGFGYNAENRAYDTNAENRARDYQQGAALAAYAPESLEQGINLNMGRAQNLADTELGVGKIRGYANRSSGEKFGKIGTNLANMGANQAKSFATNPTVLKILGGL